MSLVTEGQQPIYFVAENKGFVARFYSDYGTAACHESSMVLDAELSKDHGLLTIPLRLPRYLMPEWGQEEWAKLIDGEGSFFYNAMDEALVLCLSLAIADNQDFRSAVMRTASEVVIDFRGDLPNKYLPMMLGGYKVGVYRNGNNWPIWLSIQPTYDLALKEAEKIRDEAKLPQKAIISTGALQGFFSAKLGLPHILSDQVNRGMSRTSWIVLLGAVVLCAVAWFIRY
jgi:hypothetical protein